MARIPYSGGVPSVAPSPTAPAVYQDLRPNESAWTAQGRAMESVGRGIADVGKGIGAAASQYEDAAISAGRNDFQTRTRNLLYGDPNKTVTGPDGSQMADTGYLGLEGQAAMKARPQVEQQIDAWAAEIRSSLGREAAAQRFDQDIRRYKESVFEKTASHARSSADTWYKSVNTAAGVNALTDIGNNPDDQRMVDLNTDALISSRIKNLQLAGLADDPGAVRATMEGALRDSLKARVQAISVKEPARALAMWEDAKDIAGPEYDNVATQLRARADQQTGIGAGDAAIAAVNAKTPAQVAPAGASSQPAVMAAIRAQEGGPSENVFQIQPGTWQRFAHEGERIDNPSDNAAVAARYMEHLSALPNVQGDPERVAVGYFSGEGNIAPAGAPTPWVRDVADRNGKTVSSYVSDIRNRLAQGAPSPVSGLPTADGISAMKADAMQMVLDDPALKDKPGATSAALTQIGRHYEMLDARRVDAERQRTLAKQALKEASDTAENGYIANLTGNSPTATAQMVGNDPKLLPDAKLRMISFVERTTKPDPLAKVSHNTTIAALQRMQRPEGDPLRISNANQITQLYIDGSLNKADFTFLQEQFKGQQNSAGENLAKTSDQFTKLVKEQIDPSGPLGSLDPDGGERYYRFNRFVNQRIQEMRDAKKDPWDLFNPAKPEYLGKPEVLAPFKTTLQQAVIEHMKAVLGTAAVAPAQPAPAAPAPAATPPADVRPAEVPADARFSPSQGKWWWQVNGKWAHN